MTPAALAALHARCFDPPLAWSAESFASLLREPSVTLLDHPSGAAFALVRLVADEGELLTLATDPALRRRGHARALMIWFENLARAQGARRLHLEVAEDNHAARALYAACGFAPAGRRPGYYRGADGAPVAALLLARALDGVAGGGAAG